MGKIRARKNNRVNFRAISSSLRNGGADTLSLGLVAGAGFISFLDMFPLSLLAFIVTFGAMRALFIRIDQGLPLTQIAALLACLQWLVGPVWYYERDFNHAIMGMAVSSEEYLNYAIPGTAAFVLGLLIFGYSLKQRSMMAMISHKDFFVIGLALNGIALAGDLAGRLGPAGLSFAFFLISQLRYVGVLYLWFSPKPGAKWLAGIATLPLFFATAGSAMFHDMLLWSGLLFCFWFATRKRLAWQKFAVLVAAGLVALTIQGVKQSYRAKVWKNQDASLTAEIVTFWTNLSDLEPDEIEESLLLRLNQGWIVSTVMHHVPAAEPFARGDTINDAFIAAAVPRFLMPDKAMAGGRVNYTRFTGLPINESTSMNISLLGEGYANFGSIGGTAFLFFTGLGISLSVAICLKWSTRYPVFIFWIPLIFYQAIKAETDLTEILNHIIKGGALAFSCYWVVEKLFPTKLRSIGRQRMARPLKRDLPLEADDTLIQPQRE